MPNNKRHSAKQVKGKGVSKSSGSKDGIHPSSRKATQLQRTVLRTTKLDRKKVARQRLTLSKVDKINYFKYAMDPERRNLNAEEVHAIIHDFLARHDDEIKAEQDRRRPGRPASARLDSLIDDKRIEMEEYKSGFEVPDLMDEENVQVLRKWEGDATSLWRLKMTRLADPDTIFAKEQEAKMDM